MAEIAGVTSAAVKIVSPEGRPIAGRTMVKIIRTPTGARVEMTAQGCPIEIDLDHEALVAYIEALAETVNPEAQAAIRNALADTPGTMPESVTSDHEAVQDN